MSENNGNQRDNRDAEAGEVEEKLLHNGTKPPEDEKCDHKEKNGTETEVKMSHEIDKLLKDMPITDDMTCGFGMFKGKFFQSFANQTAYVCLYGLVGCIFSMTFAYFNGTITTIEKRFKIPSKNTGIISVGNDISQLFVSAALSYYAGKGHRPRWIGFGLLTIVAFCLLTALPHFLYGPGEDALFLTEEFGAMASANVTDEVLEAQRTKSLCKNRGDALECEINQENFAPQVVLFIAQFISGIGGSLYYTLGVAYMDDNTKKSNTPALLSLSYFLRMLGPALGYALASFCLKVYIVPQLKPVIGKEDPRWLGAWWMGWLILGALLTASGFFLAMFPKELPRAAARRAVEAERRKLKGLEKQVSDPDIPASFNDMLATFKRLITNVTLMCNNFSSVFYFFGYTPFWIFTPKYIEIQYRLSASSSNLVTGTVALAFSAAGVLLSGFVISKYKPKARYMAAWNVFVGFCTAAGIISYSFIGCPDNERSVIVNIHDSSSLTTTCNSNCQCDYVRYEPVCGEDGMTYISPCHAGCKQVHTPSSGQKTYFDCSCVQTNHSDMSPVFERLTALNASVEKNPTINGSNLMELSTSLATSIHPDSFLGGQAIPGACPVQCFNYFVIFIAVMCSLKFIGASGRASNFLVSVRCVPEKDKTAAMGFGLMMMSLFAFIPSPIFFGWVIDKLCLVWGRTCTRKGNCWLYDPESLRYTLNLTAAVFVILGSLFDVAVWYYVKDLKIFDEDVKDVEINTVQHEEDVTPEKKAEI